MPHHRQQRTEAPDDVRAMVVDQLTAAGFATEPHKEYRDLETGLALMAVLPADSRARSRHMEPYGTFSGHSPATWSHLAVRRSWRASWSPIADCTSRRSGRAP